VQGVGWAGEAQELLHGPLRGAGLVQDLRAQSRHLVAADHDSARVLAGDGLGLGCGEALGEARRIRLAGVEWSLVHAGGHRNERDAEPLQEGPASRRGARKDELHGQWSWPEWCSRMCLASSLVK
jgi:hypothetical protein